MLQIVLKHLVMSALNYNTDMANGNIGSAIASDAECRVIMKMLREAGLKLTAPMKTTKITASCYAGRSCDLYRSIEFETDDPDVIRTLKNLDFKSHQTDWWSGMILKL